MASAGNSQNTLQFIPFNSLPDPVFWSKLTELKLHQWKLDEAPKEIFGFFTNSDAPGVPCRFSVDFNAFSKSPPANSFLSHGQMLVINTIESFKNSDKQALLDGAGRQIFADIQSGRAMRDPSLLSRFILLTYINIKKYHYYYWFAFPALAFPVNIRVKSKGKLSSTFNEVETKNLSEICHEFTHENKSGYFAVQKNGEKFQLMSLENVYGSGSSDFEAKNSIFLAFCDPSTSPEYPGWTLRNLLALHGFYTKWRGNLNVICWRQRVVEGRLQFDHSLLLSLEFDIPPESIENIPKTFGWEKNEKGFLGPQFLDLSRSLDPVKLAESAVNLNLQLMRWRLVPDLQLNLMQQSKCLLFGAGTLGSNIARCLLGWGVHQITFVDNAKVSFSNPVRQSLVTFEDCLHGGRGKAEAAAENLKKIYPMVKSNGYNLTVPMPGHRIEGEAEKAELKKTLETIENLIQSHEVLFLLTDTRESRWLPTLLGALHRKLTFSVALGFDSYVVIRHGFGLPGSEDFNVEGRVMQQIPGDQLACYFCSDVVAPGDSTQDRTLDQQCTVTRPGVSYMAAALAVELFASVLQHPLQALAPAETTTDGPESIGCLGACPHQIRGFLGRFEQMNPTVQRFNCCTACSRKVVNEYQKRGIDFIIDVLDDATLLERLTGLAELQMNMENLDIVELSDSESVQSAENL